METSGETTGVADNELLGPISRPKTGKQKKSSLKKFLEFSLKNYAPSQPTFQRRIKIASTSDQRYFNNLDPTLKMK